MIKNLMILIVLLAAYCQAKVAEKVSEDENFVVYRIPVSAFDLQPQATGYDFEEPSYGRSNSKTVSHSKSHSQSSGSGKGRGFGGGSSGHGYGTGGGGGGGGGGSGSGSGGGGGSHYHHQPSHGSGPSYGGQQDSHGHHYSSGPSYFRGGQGYGSGSGYNSGGYDGGSPQNSNTNHYDDEGGPKIYTTTKTYTSTNNNPNHHHQSSASPIGEINYRLSDYVKDAPGHELSTKFSQKFYAGGFSGHDYMNGVHGQKIDGGIGPAEIGGSYRSEGPAFNVNDFTRSLNQGTGGFGGQSLFAPPGRHGLSHRNFGNSGSPSQIFPQAYVIRHSGFGLNV